MLCSATPKVRDKNRGERISAKLSACLNPIKAAQDPSLRSLYFVPRLWIFCQLKQKHVSYAAAAEPVRGSCPVHKALRLMKPQLLPEASRFASKF